MSSLGDTQLPFLLRDLEKGLEPKQYSGESSDAYYTRLTTHYHLDKNLVVKAMTAPRG